MSESSQLDTESEISRQNITELDDRPGDEAMPQPMRMAPLNQ